MSRKKSDSESVKLNSSDGRSYSTECAKTEHAFRIIQSIPSPKAEPFNQWLAKVGYGRVQEIDFAGRPAGPQPCKPNFGGFFCVHGVLDYRSRVGNTNSSKPAGPLPQGTLSYGGSFVFGVGCR